MRLTAAAILLLALGYFNSAEASWIKAPTLFGPEIHKGQRGEFSDRRRKVERVQVVPSQGVIACDRQGCGNLEVSSVGSAPAYKAAGRAARHAGGLGPRPRAWCGWWLRKHTGRLDPDLNRARAWLKFPRTSPRPGAFVVWARGKGGGHVGQIVEMTGGCTALVISGNDGGAVRTRERNICNALGVVS
jgi:hypothetical protein